MPTYLEAYRAARARQDQAESSAAATGSSPNGADHIRFPLKPPSPPTPLTQSPFIIAPLPAKKTQSPIRKDTAPADTPASKLKPVKSSPTKQQTIKKQAKPKLDIPKQKGQWDSKDVRTKFARWHTLDEPFDPYTEEAPALWAYSDDGNDDTVGQHGGLDIVEAAAPGPQAGEVKQDARKADLVRTAPKKRIVSDEHWKRSRPAARSTPEQPKAENIVIEGGLYVPPGRKTPEGWARPMTMPSKKGQPGWVRIASETSPKKPQPQLVWTGQRSKSAEIKRGLNRIGETGPVEIKTRKASKPELETVNVWKTRPLKLAATKPEKIASPRAGSAPSTPSTDSGNRMAAWLLRTPDPKIEDIGDPNEGFERPHSVSDLGSMLGPRQTTVHRRAEDDTRRRHRRKSVHSESHSSAWSDQDSQHSPSLGLMRSPAMKKASSPKLRPDRFMTVEAAETFPLGRTSVPAYTNAIQLAMPLDEPEHQMPGSYPTTRRRPTAHLDLSPVLASSNDSLYRSNARDTLLTTRSKLGDAPLENLLQELRSDEEKYRRDLRTLLDGVIPVLLNTILSRSNSTNGANLPTGFKDVSMAKDTIIDLGVSLERLQSSHKGLLAADSESIISWFSRSHDIYADYIKAWRLGFQDMIVNLAPAEGANDGVGERADITYLLKRPLVRLKCLTKMIKAINLLRPSMEAARWSSKFQDLVEEARVKQDIERARLEDEAAAAIDATRARNPETLAPLPGVTIRSDRCVRARDTFDLHLSHSSGQKLDCRVMLYLRNDSGGALHTGDVLFCQTENSSRWLLFPPADRRQLSARFGDAKTDLVVMIRGPLSTGQEWRELIRLTTTDENITAEWLQLLGGFPVPPTGALPSITNRSTTAKALNPFAKMSSPEDDDDDPSDLDLPLGEQSVLSSRSRQAKPKHPTEARIEAWLQQNPSQVGTGDQWNPQADLASIPSSASNSIRPAESDGGISHYQPPAHNFAKRAKNNLKNIFSDLQAVSAPLPVEILQKPVEHRRSSGRPFPYRPLSPIQSETSPSAERDPGIHPESISPKSSPPDPGPLSRQRYHGRTQSSSSPPSSPQAIPSSPSSSKIRGVSTPHLNPTTPKSDQRRRSSSPLKYEYEPSSPSNASSAMGDLMSDDGDSITSGSSVDDMIPIGDLDDVVGSLKQPPLRTRPNSTYAPMGPATVAPSQSASHTPYRDLPGQEESKVGRTIASIFSWSDKGRWELLHADECSIIVSPGLIEAYKMSAAHSRERPEDQKPLVALELTPLVPLRQGTAIDISIRSPPTANSQIRTSSNIMFRSRTGNECDALYQMINQARINNLRYMALQNARGTMGGSGWAAHMDRQANVRSGSAAWWQLKSKKGSYRASSRHQKTASVAETRSSVASRSSAISALKRFSTGSKMFNVAKSTIIPRAGLGSPNSKSRTSTSWTSSAGSGGSGTSTPPVGHARLDPSRGTPAGITEQKIRLYERETSSRWRDMGSARMTIMHPPRPASVTTAQLLTTTGQLKQEKRIIVTGKTKGETLLDAVLGETAFERVARTGLAVKIWEHHVVVGKTGGVGSARVRTFMIQMKSEAEAAYAFSLLGRLRY